MKRGKREEAIIQDLEAAGSLTIQHLVRVHPRASVYAVLKRLKERGEGRYIKVKQNGKLLAAFQLLKKKASDEEVRLLLQLLSVEKPPKVMKEAAKDLMALASKYEIIPDEAVNFLVNNWYQPQYASVQGYLLTALERVVASCKAKGSRLQYVVDVVKQHTVDKILEVAKNFSASPGLRQTAWGLLILLEEPRTTEVALELLTREEEQEVVLDFVKDQILRYADENPINAKRRLYNILLKSKEGTPTYRRILSLLQLIREHRFREVRGDKS